MPSPTALTGITCLSFDVGGTLLHPFPGVGEVYSEVLARHGIAIQPSALNAGFKKAFTTTPKASPGQISEASERIFWRTVVDQTAGPYLRPGCFVSETAFEELYEAFATARRWRVSEGAEEALRKLKARGLRLAILTNSDKRFGRVLEEIGLAGLFDAIVYSSVCGFEKPHPQAFAAVFEALGAAPEQVLHIGDSATQDADGALLAGAQALLYLPELSADPRGHGSFRKFSELPGLIG